MRQNGVEGLLRSPLGSNMSDIQCDNFAHSVQHSRVDQESIGKEEGVLPKSVLGGRTGVQIGPVKELFVCL